MKTLLRTAIVAMLVFSWQFVLAQYSVRWEKSSARGSLPGWMGTNHTERGFAYGKVGGKDRVYVVARKTAANVVVLDAATGDSVSVLTTTGISGGTFALNDVGVSSDGFIFACNVAINTGSDTTFRVYKWSNEGASPAPVITYRTPGRLGDKFTVVGSTADNSIVIYAAASNSPKVVKFTTTDNGATFTGTEITLSGDATNTQPSVGPTGTGSAEFYLKSAGRYAKRYGANGALIDSISGTVLGTGSNAIRYFTKGAKKYVAVFQYGSGTENARIIDVTNGAAAAVSYCVTPTLGQTSNTNGAGDVALKDNGDGTFDVFVLSCNNGVGCYRLDLDYIKVTFNTNAAAVTDTLGPRGLIQLRGTTMTAAGQTVDDGTTDTLAVGTIIDWNAKSTMYLKNIGGDYWQGSFMMKTGTKLAFKFFANAQYDTVRSGDSYEHYGWEMNLKDISGVYSGNRGLILTGVTKDTVLPMQFVNGIGHGAMAQYDKPYTTNDSTFVLHLRVNMSGWEDFNPANHKVGARGSNMSDWGQTGELSWGKSFQLNREGTSKFYSNALHVPNKYATAGVKFKFVVHYAANPLDEDWSKMAYNPGAEYEVQTRGIDSTVYWKWFDNLRPVPATHADTLYLTYQVNLNKALSERGFSHGDTLQIRAGYGGTASKLYTKRLSRVGLTTVYSAIDTLVGSVGKSLVYQYYLVKYGQELREIYFDFDFPDPSSSEAERRRITVPTKTYTLYDTSAATASPRRVPRLRNTSKLARAVTVKYTVDMRPAIYQVARGDTLRDIQGTIHVTKKDSVLKWGAFINGPATTGWGPWGGALRADTSRKLYDDGTHGDAVAGDSIFTRTYSYTTADILGQEFKFGIGGGDNEAGFGNNHYYIIDDTGPTTTAPSQFGSIYPKFYTAWDFDLGRPKPVTAVDDIVTVAYVFELSQNYPNPFNPATSIQFTIPTDDLVSLKVFNVLGQELTTVVNERMKAGKYTITFDASKLASGVYFYQITAGQFVETKKMVLLK